MDLARIPEIGPDHARVLAEAGVRTAAQLAALPDLEATASRTGLDASLLETLRAAAWLHLERVLEEAGVRGPEELARADVDDLVARTGLSRESLVAFQGVARARMGGPAPGAAANPLPDRVILSEGRATARVSLGGEVRAGLAIVTLRMEEDEDAVLSRVPGDAVLLKERAATAPARVEGVLHRALPIYKEEPAPEGEPAEIRVRVAQIKDRRGPEPDAPAAAAAPAPEAGEAPRKKGLGLFRRGK